MSKYYLRSIGLKDNALAIFCYGPFLTEVGAELARKQTKYPGEFEIFLSPCKTVEELVSSMNRKSSFEAHEANREPIYEAVAMTSMREVIDKPSFLSKAETTPG